MLGAGSRMTAFSAWCVVATDKTFEARELPHTQLTAPFVLAVHPSRDEAEKAANRAILFREQAEASAAAMLDRERSERAKMEPGSSTWAASVAHEIAILNKVTRSALDIVQPRAAAKA